MTADPGVPPAFVDRLLRVVEQQAEATGRIAVLLDRLDKDHREGVAAIKQHTENTIQAAGPPKLVGWIVAGGTAIIAAALGALATFKGIRHE